MKMRITAGSAGMKLYEHQKQAVEFILDRGGSGAVYHEIGTGKTLTGLSIYSRLKEKEPDLKLLVICPISLIEAAWGEDIKKFTSFSYCNLRQDMDFADIYLINYEALLRKNYIIPEPRMCIIDESSKMKNPTAKTTKKILSIRNQFKYRVVASGTPAPNVETEYHSQISFVADRIFHPSFYAFRNYYFHLQRGKQAMQGQVLSKSLARELFSKGWKYQITPQKKLQLTQKLQQVCHFAKKKDCLDLPEQIDEFRSVEMSKDQARFYNEMRRDAITEIRGSEIVATVALAKLMKLRQATSGFMIDTLAQAKEIPGPNPKLKELMDLLEEAGDNQAIIWCNFHWEIETIEKLLTNKCVTLYGKTKDKDESIRLFKNGEARYLIAHGRSAGHGLTLTNCNLQIFFSLDYSWEIWEQCRGRTHRSGQRNPCVYVHLLAKDTIDWQIMGVLKRKGKAIELVEEICKEKRG